MSKQGTVVAVVGTAVGLGVIGYLGWALYDMKKQRDVAVARHAEVSKQLAAMGGMVGNLVPKPAGVTTSESGA